MKLKWPRDILFDEPPESFWDYSKWREEQKVKYPKRYFVFYTIPLFLSKYSPKEFKYYLTNRFVFNSIYMTPSKKYLKPGNYYELEDVMFHGLFGAVVDFVEIECASIGRITDRTYKKKWFASFRPERSRELGIKHLKESHEVDPMGYHQELLDLYLWYVDEYPRIYEESEKSVDLDLSDKLYRVENEKLKQIIDLRNYMWT